MGTAMTLLESYELTGFFRICMTTFEALLKFHDFILPLVSQWNPWFLHVKFIVDFRMIIAACSGHQFSLCRQFTYMTVFLPTVHWQHTHYIYSPNQFHVHMYISHWGPEEQSPSLEINFDSRISCTQHPAHPASISAHLMKEVETGEPMQTLNPLPLPCPSACMCTDLATPWGNLPHLFLCPLYAGHNSYTVHGILGVQGDASWDGMQWYNFMFNHHHFHLIHLFGLLGHCVLHLRG